MISLVDLGKELESRDPDLDALSEADSQAVEAAVAAASELIETRIVLVLEFNEVTTGFLVDGVNRIHRVSWDAISPLSSFLAAVHSKFTGSVSIENCEVLVVDMARILSDILPGANGLYQFSESHDTTDDERRAEIPVYLAEDSVTIRAVMENELKRGGYAQVHVFDNGKACFEALQMAVNRARAEDRPVTDEVGILLSEIEMPQMDGMTLCKRFKSDFGQKDIPVILFSSLINEQIARKCESVGADSYISKPRFDELIAKVDEYVL